MMKRMSWARNFGHSSPNVCKSSCIRKKLRSIRLIVLNEDNDQGVNRDRFRERHSQNRYGQNAAESSRISPDGFSCFRSDKTDSDTGAESRTTQRDATTQLG